VKSCQANPYEDPCGQETHLPSERIVCFLPPPSSVWRRCPLAPCADVIALGWCDTHVAAPHTYGGSTARAMAMAESRGTVVCAREPSLSPPTVRCHSGAAQLEAPVRARCGGGAAHRTHQDRPPDAEVRAQASKHTRRVRAQGR
jgi:hypothetical protein